jgi:hypothetical protein
MAIYAKLDQQGGRKSFDLNNLEKICANFERSILERLKQGERPAKIKKKRGQGLRLKFESLKIRIWILFVICELVLGIFSIKELN